MASYKISDISAEQTTPVETDIFEIETTGGTSKKTLLSTILKVVSTLTSKATPVSGDCLLINDSADSNNAKYITLSALSSLVGEPIGTIKSWDKSFPSCPSLPDSYVECDGSAISDGDSVFDGYRSRLLNNDSIAFSVTWSSGVATIASTDVTALLLGHAVSGGAIAAGAYITDITGTTVTMSDTSYSGTLSTTFTETNGGRYLRGDTTSGVGNIDKFQGHRFYSGKNHNSTAATNTGIYGTTANDAPGSATQQGGAFAGAGGYQVLTSLPKDDGTNGTPRTGLETSVLDMTVVWIMKIK